MLVPVARLVISMSGTSSETVSDPSLVCSVLFGCSALSGELPSLVCSVLFGELPSLVPETVAVVTLVLVVLSPSAVVSAAVVSVVSVFELQAETAIRASEATIIINRDKRLGLRCGERRVFARGVFARVFSVCVFRKNIH